MTSIKENLEKIHQQITETALACGRQPEEIQLIAVSKKKDIPTVTEGIRAGAGHLGENYIQEAREKIEHIGTNAACWHFIGHLQSNKAKYAVRYFEYIHTVDTVKLATEIDKEARKRDKIQKILIQANIADEETKSGVSAKAIEDLVKEVLTLDNVSVQGLMCMPPFFPNPEKARPYFKKLFQIRDQIVEKSSGTIRLPHLSMGMSNDFKVAIEEGATMVRVGTAIFGERF